MTENSHRSPGEPACCPTCGQTLVELTYEPNSGDDLLGTMRLGCLEYGITPTLDGFISEAAAAKLTGKSKRTLRRWRELNDRIPWRKRAGRIEYALADIAHWQEQNTEKSY